MIEVSIMMILGLVIGSFLNVCIYRIPEGQSINFPRSHCRWCNHTLGVLDLVPVFSYIFLGGKCRYCKKKISPQYACIELLNASLYGMAAYYFGLTAEGVMVCAFLSGVIVLTLIDIRYMLLPQSILGTMVGIGLLLRGVISYQQGTMAFFAQGIIGGIVGYGILYILYYAGLFLLGKEGMGYGDVRYLGVIGLFTSWQSVVLTLWIAAIVGALYGCIQLYIRKKSEPYPFGPYLSIGGVVSIFYGTQIMTWYMSLKGF